MFLEQALQAQAKSAPKVRKKTKAVLAEMKVSEFCAESSTFWLLFQTTRKEQGPSTL